MRAMLLRAASTSSWGLGIQLFSVTALDPDVPSAEATCLGRRNDVVFFAIFHGVGAERWLGEFFYEV